MFGFNKRKTAQDQEKRRIEDLNRWRRHRARRKQAARAVALGMYRAIQVIAGVGLAVVAVAELAVAIIEGDQ